MEKLRDTFIIIGVCMIGGLIFNHIYEKEKQSKNKLITYIAVQEDCDFEDVKRRFEVCQEGQS